MRVAQGKRSAALGNEAIMNTPLSSFSAVPPLPGGTAEKEERGWSWGGYPGRQSLRAFALGYYLVAPSGRQTEPPASAMNTLTRIWPNQPAAPNPAIASRFHGGGQWRGVADLERWRRHHLMHHPTQPTKKYTMRFWATALALAVCSLLITGCHTASLRPSEMVADSVSGFSGKQGANGWSYGYWDRTADTDKSYSQTTDFQLLRHFGSDPINGLSSRSDFTTGKLWILQDGLYYTAVWAEGASA